MNEMLSAVGAPWTTILTLASGYAGYFVAHVGLRDHHGAVDAAFRVLVYGFWGMLAFYGLTLWAGVGLPLASLASMGLSVAVGAFWRKAGRGWAKRAMRATWLSHNDDLPTAWAALLEAGDRTLASQVQVHLTDGRGLFCEDLSRFSDLPNGSCCLGARGDFLIYATHMRWRDAKGEMQWEAVGDLEMSR